MNAIEFQKGLVFRFRMDTHSRIYFIRKPLKRGGSGPGEYRTAMGFMLRFFFLKVIGAYHFYLGKMALNDPFVRLEVEGRMVAGFSQCHD